MSEDLPPRLPVYRVADVGFDEPEIGKVVKAVDLERGTRTLLPNGDIRIADGSRVLEITSRGSYWFADEDVLWNPDADLGPLPDRSRALALAEDLLGKSGLRPESSGGARVFSPIVVYAGTKMARAHRPSGGTLTREYCRVRDSYVGFGPRLDIGTTASPLLVDVIGLGAKVGTVFGAGERVIGMNASWRRLAAKFADFPWLPPEPPPLIAAAVASSVRVDRHSAKLVYRVVALADGTRVLAPFWLFKVSFRHEGQHHRSIDVTTPAVDIDLARGPDLPFPYCERTPYSRPHVGSSPFALGASWSTDEDPTSEQEAAALLAKAICNHWDVRFAWRTRDAWQSDWAAQAGDWADGVDLAFYSGHAYRNGWLLVDRHTGCPDFLSTEAVGAEDPKRRIWHRRLKWVLVGACGPLQDDCVLKGSGDAFTWVDAFNGLRLLAGFASTIAGFTGEGARAFELAAGGVPLARAWFRATRERQPFADSHAREAADSERWAAVLGVRTDRGWTLDDRLTSAHGPGPRDPTDFIAMWSPA
jgi:hypothetical protein